MAPKRSRPSMDASYGLTDETDGMLDWDWVCDQMQKSRNYWVCTTSPSGAPHAAPVWGVWVDEILYFATGGKSRKGRNIAADPRTVIHLESGDETVIFEGTLRKETDDKLLQRIVTDYGKKYPYQPELPMPDGDAFYALDPTKVMAWLESDFPKTAAKFTFD